MRILHYSLGLPPYRSGGLTKYCTDLMKQQVKNGDDVILLFPGRINKYKTNIKYYKKYFGINVYEIINPLPVALLGGVCNPIRFMEKIEHDIYYNYLKDIKPDIVHIHTIMGLHKEFLEACKVLNIKIAFTTHDYYGICNRGNFIDRKHNICESYDVSKCAKCNILNNNNSIKKITLLQSRVYREVKNIGIIDYFKDKIIFRNSSVNNLLDEGDISKNEIENYQKLVNYYREMYLLIDIFLYNSSLSKEIYYKYLNNPIGYIENITHSDIKDFRIKKSFKEERLNVLYLGPNKPYKGFNLICNVLEEVEKRGYDNISLSVYGNCIGINKFNNKNLSINGKYKYKDLENIFKNIDILIIPSICIESFGFTALEALSYGVPIIVTKSVGSKDLININKSSPIGFIVDSNINSIADKMIQISNDKKILIELNENIINMKFEYDIQKHTERIKNIYKLNIKEK